MKRLFEYAIILQEKEEKGKVIDNAAILVEPKVVLATDVAEVNIVASRAIPDEYIGELERITLAVRPF